ncbi:MAG: class I SAM-dependent methyltransferase [Deltaproteobacteria bacterium]|nr:class I SAM-dependent methyltransferase [Deltaproteobacteria bacterium]
MEKARILLFLLVIAPLCSAFTDLPVKPQSQFEDVTMDVPYITTSRKAVDKILEMAQVGPQDLLYDLGSGDGRIVIAAAEQRGARGVGVEIDGELVRESRRKAAKAKVADRVEFIESDLFQVDFSRATVVTLYLMPDLNLRLRPTLLTTLRPGSRVVSHTWDMGEWQSDQAALSPSQPLRLFPDKTFRRSYIYLWIIPANFSDVWEWRDGDGKTSRQLRIVQRFQKAEGVWNGERGEQPAVVTISGDRIRVAGAAGGNQKTPEPVFEGRIGGDVIEGTVTLPGGPQHETRPWKAVRRPNTMTPLGE